MVSGMLSRFHLQRLVERYPCHRMNYRLVCVTQCTWAVSPEQYVGQVPFTRWCQKHGVHMAACYQTDPSHGFCGGGPKSGLGPGLRTHSHHYITKGRGPLIWGELAGGKA